MKFQTISDFARYLESIGELHRVSVEVDPYLEVTEIATRAVREKKPAILFEKVKGSSFPLLINALASERRCELALQKHPQELGTELIRFVESAMPPKVRTLFANPRMVKRFLASRPAKASSAVSQEVVQDADLERLPVLDMLA